jgi:pyruvate/2-oxoacid:ferredoxin oxidoreductase beta subunit/Pyruvate/2-oxoacid:ferredoxin oxidoreductase gamma subunit
MTGQIGGTVVTPLATYRNAKPYPFCPGCGHGSVLDRLNEALVARRVDPARVVLVSDIGCSGLSDQYFATSAFHGLHGRSLTYAAGLKLARPELDVVVILGDGGTGIGGAHLLNAARRNVGLTALVLNNLNFGMTGGQHSTTTPDDAITSTTPGGNLEHPLDLCATAAVNGAAYVWRGTSFDDDLAERIAEAMATPGFALLDVWELCTAFFVPKNKASKRTLGELMDRLGFQRGLVQKRDVAEYAAAYRARAAETAGHDNGDAAANQAIATRFTSSLDRRFGLLVAGSAGGGVRSATRLVARAAVAGGLWAAQRDDYPVTVKSGHSLSALVLDPQPVESAGLPRPDAVVVLSDDGRRKVAPLLLDLAPEAKVFLAPGVGDVETPARVVRLAPQQGASVAKRQLVVATLAAAVRELDLVPAAALAAAADARDDRFADALAAADALHSHDAQPATRHDASPTA